MVYHVCKCTDLKLFIGALSSYTERENAGHSIGKWYDWTPSMPTAKEYKSLLVDCGNVTMEWRI